MSLKTELQVLLSPEALTKINYWVQVSTVEISGLGKCKYDASKHAYIVSDVWLLEQENGPTTTDIEASAAAKLLYETRETEGDLNFWWHSHVNMAVFWSGTDTDTIKEFGDNGYCLATVFNKKREMRSAFYQGANGFLPSVFLDNLKTDTYYMVDEALLKKCQSEFEAKCTIKTYKPLNNYTQYTGNQNKETHSRDFNKTLYSNDYLDSYYDDYENESYGFSYQKKQDIDDYLGFEFNGSMFILEKVYSGTKSYAGYNMYNALTDLKQRGHGDLNPYTYTLWDENKESWETYDEFVKINLDDYPPTILSTAPFDSTDWKKICDLYKIIFSHAPLCAEDITEFFTDFMDITWSELWEIDPRIQGSMYEEYKLQLEMLKEKHTPKEKAI